MNYKTIFNIGIPLTVTGGWLTAAYFIIAAVIAAVMAVAAISPWLAFLVALASLGVLVWLAIWSSIALFAIVGALLLWVNGAFK